MGWKPIPLETPKQDHPAVIGVAKVRHRAEPVYDPTWGRKPFLSDRGLGKVYNQTVIPEAYKRKPDIEPKVKGELSAGEINAPYVKWLWQHGWEMKKIASHLNVKYGFVANVVSGRSWKNASPLKPPGLDAR